MEIWGQQIVNALTIGGMYTLVAVGFTLFFGVLNLINFAHGEIFMYGAFVGLVAAGVAKSLGISDGLFAFKPVRGMPPLILLVTSLAVGIAMREALKEFFPEGANPKAFPSPFEYDSVTIASVKLDYTQIGLIVLSILLIFGVYLIVNKTWMGRAMRATSEDPDAARMMGVEVDAVIRNTFLLGSALGGAAGVMNGLYYLSIRFDMGWVMAIKGFTAAVIGGLGNVYGAVFGGFFLAFIEVLIVALVPYGSTYKDVIVFIILILILVFRPSGLLKAPPPKMG
jgi:branched-chain amino acid transport system permease protein